MSGLVLKVPTGLGVERVCRLLCALRGEDANAVGVDVCGMEVKLWERHRDRVREVMEIVCALEGLSKTEGVK